MNNPISIGCLNNNVSIIKIMLKETEARNANRPLDIPILKSITQVYGMLRNIKKVKPHTINPFIACILINAMVSISYKSFFGLDLVGKR